MTTNPPSQDLPPPTRRQASVLAAATMVILLSLVQLFVAAYLIPRFSEMYQDMLGGRRLPSSTAIVLQFRWGLVGLAGIWPVCALVVVRRRAALRYLLPISGLLLLTLAFTILALFVPLSGTIIQSGPLSPTKTLRKSPEVEGVRDPLAVP